MDSLYEEAVDAINTMFADTSVSQAETAANLEALKEEIDFLIENLNSSDN